MVGREEVEMVAERELDSRWFNPEGPATSQEVADYFARFLIEGLRASTLG